MYTCKLFTQIYQLLTFCHIFDFLLLSLSLDTHTIILLFVKPFQSKLQM